MLNTKVSHKILTLFFLTVAVAALGNIFYHTPSVFIATSLLLLLNFGYGVKLLHRALSELDDIITVIRKISYGDYNVKIDTSKNKELEVVSVMAQKLKDHDLYISQRAYQTTMLKEIAERISSSLDVRDALEIISGSLRKVVTYSTVSYVAPEKDNKVVFKCHLEESVSKAFTEEVKKKMLDTFKALANAAISEEDIKTIYFGTIFDESEREPVRSFFNLPMVVGNELVGLINVASTKPNLYNEQEVAILYMIIEQAGSTITRIRGVLTEEMSRVDSMLTAVNDGLIMITKEGEMPLINKKMKEFLNITDDKKVSAFDIVHLLYGIFDIRGAMDQALAENKAVTFPKILIGRTYYKVTANPVNNSKGEPHAIVFVFSDITQEEEIDKMKSEFISTTSHQLRTPLSSIKWFLEMLINGDLGALNDKQKGVVTDIYNSNERIIALVNDLLDVSRIESGKVTLEPTPTNMVEFINSMLTELKQMFTKREQEFAFTHPESVPRIMLDPKLVWQVLQNLLTNASKYTPDKGKISLALSLEPDCVLIKVIDNGFGIPDFQKKRVFEKFFRADNVSKMEGTGLGLYIAKEIIEASGGKLWFESTEGKGSTFFITLPLSGAKANAKVVSAV